MASSTAPSTARNTVTTSRIAGHPAPLVRRTPSSTPAVHSHRRPAGAVHGDRRPAGCSGVAVRVARRQRRQRVMRRRLVAVVILAGVVLAGGRAAYGTLGGPSLAPSGRPASASPLAQTTVRAGDSLWTVAKRLAPGQDPRPVVDALAAGRHGAPLVPGELIVWAR